MKISRLLLAALTAFAFALPSSAVPLAGKRPNIIFLLTDDQGYGDLSAHGNPILKTPNLDRLNAEAVRFEDFCVSPTCAPTRSALLTGRHEFKNGITHTILERERMTLQATTLPQVLKTAGYTTGIFGKWHLGDEPEYWPSARGFDEMFIHGAGGIGQTYPGSCGDVPGNKYFDPIILHNGKFEKTSGYCTDVFFTQAKKWIESVKGKQPFYCHLSTNAPHGPYIARPEDKALFEGKVEGEDVQNFFGMLHNIDQNLGQLLDKLKEWGIENDTLVVFMNDNGGTAGTKVFNAGLRAQKGSPWMGGIKASSLWRWPGTLQPAPVTKLTAHIDFFPTLAELAGARLSSAVQAQVEGRSLVPLLENPAAEWPDRELFTHVGRWPKDADPQGYKFANCSVRSARWHLVSVPPVKPRRAAGEAGSGAAPGVAKWELFDLPADPGEKTDVAGAQPEVVQRLAAAYGAWWDSVQPLLVNEKAPLAPENPFKTLYRTQFGSVPGEK